MHSNALDDPLFVAATELFVNAAVHPGEREDAEHCVACHNPTAYRSGRIKESSSDYSNVDDITRRSITCDLCHTVDEVVTAANASFNTDPGDGEEAPGVKREPRDDAEPVFHRAEYSEIHTSSEFCGACHNVTHLWYMTRLEGTYDEWFHSPYNSADPGLAVTCQDCHMRQSPGNPSTGMTGRPDYPGASAVMGEERPHIYRHYVSGGNTLIPSVMGRPGRKKLAEERLKHAAVLEIVGREETGEKVSALTIRVRNEGAGHMLPTGVTEFREMWLEVTVKDETGEVVFFSGGTGSDGALLSGTRVFRTVFGDPDGNPTLNVTEAAMVLNDHRVHPKGWVDERFCFDEPLNAPLTVRAELKYRSMEPGLVRRLLKDDGIEVPVVTMAVVEETLE